jgi:hypothetical protein
MTDVQTTGKSSRWRRCGQFVLDHLPLLIVVVVFIVAAQYLFPGFRWQNNPDGIGYINTAKKYLDGHFHAAINGYWSPLISWLMVPLMAAGKDGILAAKLVGVATALATILAAWRLLLHMGVNTVLRFLVGLTLIPVTLDFALVVTTPDLLMACCLLFYLAQLANPRYDRHWFSAPFTGLLMAVAYFAKAYALPLVVAHFAIIAITRLVHVRGNRWRTFMQTTATVLVLAVVAGAWMGALRWKFGYWMTGSSGSYNYNVFDAPHRFTEPNLQPMENRMQPLPDPYSVSFWDDPTTYQYKKWSPFESRTNFRYQLDLIARNSNDLWEALNHYTWLALPLMLLGIVLAASSADPAPRRPIRLVTIAMVLYPIGYLLLHAVDRFFSPMSIMMLIIGAAGVQAACRAIGWAWGRGSLVMVFICSSYLLFPPYDLNRHWKTDEGPIRLAESLKGILPPGSSIASNNQWGDLLTVSYLLDLHYYGIDYDHRGNALERELNRFGGKVDYFMVWGYSDSAFLRRLPEISHGRVPGWRIYQLKKEK